MHPSTHVTDLYELQQLDSYKNDLELLKYGETALSVPAPLPSRPMLDLLLKKSALMEEKCKVLLTFPLPREISPIDFSIVEVSREFGCKQRIHKLI
jgi:hypothetical protein